MLKNPVGKYYQLSYAQKQKDKNLHAYYDQHRAVRQNISLLYQELKKAMLLQEDQSFADADHGILQPARMWKVGRSQNADLFRLEQRRNSLDFVVDILVDASGSQRPRQENVTLQTYILAETLSRLHIPFRVMSFCTFWITRSCTGCAITTIRGRRTAIFLSISHPQTTATGLLSRRRGWIF